jgi:hypothetical protein
MAITMPETLMQKRLGCSRGSPTALAVTPLRSCRRGSLAALAVTLFALVSACNWNTFDDITEKASVRVYEAPGGYNKSGYGNVMVGTRSADGATSSFITSAGGNAPIVYQDVWTKNKLSGSGALRCKTGKCSKGDGVGSTLIPVPRWGVKTPNPQHDCVLAPGVPYAYMLCQTNLSTSQNYELDLKDVMVPKAGIRFAGAGLPAGHALGVALLSAFSTVNASKQKLNGTLYFQRDFVGTNVPPNVRLDIKNPDTGNTFADSSAQDYGYAVAVHADGQKLLIAISQPAQNRVIVATYDPAIKVPVDIEDDVSATQSYRTKARACIKSPDSSVKGFGKVLAMGDINDDGVPEIFAGIDPQTGENGQKQYLVMFPGTGLPDEAAADTTCPDWDHPGIEVKCGGAACANSGFGASIAIGDVDGDMIGDLLVGAPRTSQHGIKEAGTIWIYPGDDKSERLDTARATNVYATGQAADGHLGTTVVALHTRDRDEPVGGAPGSDEIYMFMCTKLESEYKPTSLCLPK